MRRICRGVGWRERERIIWPQWCNVHQLCTHIWFRKAQAFSLLSNRLLYECSWKFLCLQFNVNYSLYLTQAGKSDLAGLEASNKWSLQQLLTISIFLQQIYKLVPSIKVLPGVSRFALTSCNFGPHQEKKSSTRWHTVWQKWGGAHVFEDTSWYRNFICPTGCCFGKRQSSFLCHWLDNKPVSYWITVTTMYNDQEGTPVDREDAIYCYLVCMSTQWCCLLVAG